MHTGATATDQGILTGKAHLTLRLRSGLDPSIAIFADASVKHGTSLRGVPFAVEIEDVITRGKADAILVTGSSTGSPADLDEIRAARAAVESIAERTGMRAGLVVASGVSAENIAFYAPFVDGFIVGTSIKKEGMTNASVDRGRVRLLLQRLQESTAGRAPISEHP